VLLITIFAKSFGISSKETVQESTMGSVFHCVTMSCTMTEEQMRECGTPCTPPLIVVVGHYAQSAAVGVAGA